MQPEQKVPLGVAEAEALAAWLETLARNLQDEETRPVYDDCIYYGKQLAFFQQAIAEAREWASVVRPVPIKRRG